MDENIKKDFYNLNYSENFKIENIEEKEIDINLEKSFNTSSSIVGNVTNELGEFVENELLDCLIARVNLLGTL